jgi:RNA polymerase sigma factor (sigma-70 family)
MIEDLLNRIQSTADLITVETAIASLPAEYGVVLDLHYAWGLSRREIAKLLGWSISKVGQRLTRGTSLLRYQLHPEAFIKTKHDLRSGL